MNKSITFVLLGNVKYPIGGYKIVYEYANRLAIKGWKVNVVHPTALWPAKRHILKKMKFYISFPHFQIFKRHSPVSWFTINPKVRILIVPNLNDKFIPDADFIVACPAVSAPFVNSYSAQKGKKFYFIQGYEDWAMKKEDIEKSWKYPMKKIVIAQWLKDLVTKFGEEATYIPNGLDFSFFKNLNQFLNRPPKSIIFLFHLQELKGTRYALEAVKILRKKNPEIIIKAFGVYPTPQDYPSFIDYYFKPSQSVLRDLYNSSAIFVSPSLSEGWPLPPAEAMMCGCVVIASDIGGHKEYIVDGVNGFLCKPASVESIVEKVEYIFNHPEIAHKISDNAPQSLKKFDWDSRVVAFESALLTE